MGVEMTLRYLGDKQTELTHGPSGNRINTDAPVDNGGKGSAFSPTDLVGAALVSCADATMAIVGEREGIELGATTGKVVKDMQASPRQIAALTVDIALRPDLSPEHRARLQTIARSCPVALSLASSVKVEMRFS